MTSRISPSSSWHAAMNWRSGQLTKLWQFDSSATPRDGVRMPPDQPLPAHKIEAIRLWIAAGAQDD